MTCALVERTAGTLVLVDTGVGAVGPVVRLVLGARVGSADHAGAQVRALGHDPRDVRDVVLTHAHVDHAGGLADFPWARVHVARAEHATLARRVVGYYRAAWRHGVNWVPYDFESDGTRDLLGDGSLVALDAPRCGVCTSCDARIRTRSSCRH